MAVDAGSRLEYALPFRNSGTRVRRLTLLFNPAVELITGLHIDAEKHLGMLCSTILSALTQVESVLLRVKPHRIGVVGNQVGLTGQTRNPEAVVCICGEQSDESRGRVSRITHGHVQLIRGHDLQTRIAILPPELMANGDHLYRVGRPGSLLDAGDHPCRRHKHNYTDDK